MAVGEAFPLRHHWLKDLAYVGRSGIGTPLTVPVQRPRYGIAPVPVLVGLRGDPAVGAAALQRCFRLRYMTAVQAVEVSEQELEGGNTGVCPDR